MNRWPTPTATDAVLWATPTTRDHRSGKASAATHARNSRPLSEQVGNLLNPTWVEWLMGWPIDWTDPSGGPSSEDFRAWLESNRTALTDYVRSATVRYHSAEPSPGNCLVGRSEGVVIAVGPGKEMKRGRRQVMQLAVGDRVVFHSYAGTDLRVAGENITVLEECDVIAQLVSP